MAVKSKLSDSVTFSGQCAPRGARSRPPLRAGFWPWPRQIGRSWCWWARPGKGSACSFGPLCCCCGASAPWASSASWSGSLREQQSFSPGWTRRRKRRGTRLARGTPSRPRGSNRARRRLPGVRLPCGRRRGEGVGSRRGADTGWRSVCTGPRAAAGSSGTTACCVLSAGHFVKY